MIRVLHVIGAMDRGGAETMIMNLYRAIDRTKVQFDFLVHEQRVCDYDEEIKDLGGEVFRGLPRFNVSRRVPRLLLSSFRASRRAWAYRKLCPGVPQGGEAAGPGDDRA